MYWQLLSMEVPKVVQYLDDNWQGIRDEWVTGLMDKQFSMNIQTNNNLESINSKFKRQ